MLGVAGDAGFGEASGEFLFGFVHGKDAFFGGHDKLGSVLEILAFFAFFKSERLKLFCREGTSNGGFFGVDACPKDGVGGGAANRNNTKNGSDDGGVNGKVSHHVGFTERPTFFGVTKNDFARANVTNKLFVRRGNFDFVDNFDGWMRGWFVLKENDVGHVFKLLACRCSVFFGVNSELGGGRELKEIFELFDEFVGGGSGAVDEDPLRGATGHGPIGLFAVGRHEVGNFVFVAEDIAIIIGLVKPSNFTILELDARVEDFGIEP